LEIKKYAAIDIGSNGVRLLVSNVILEKGKSPIFRKSALVRVPIRLGTDTFNKGFISETNSKRMCKAMKAFKLLMQVHGVEAYRACATSAMREASNGQEVANKIEKETNVHIDIIDGKTEAAIIASTDLYELLEAKKNYLYIDVGGGSTEFTLFSNGKLMESKSFKMGTVRALDTNQDLTETWNIAKEWVKKGIKKYPNCTIIGSGGNINKVFKLSTTKIGAPLSLNYLKKEYKKYKSFTYNQRIRKMGLNSDRADVIIPALKIYIAAMKWSKADKIIVPKIGLSDGIIKTLFASTNLSK
jgi:exopolyphosphatase/guanosine-5'-triphosphate,3'-diphosphate pyrophosphatase